jgi:cytosine-specific methyltransferase
MGVSRCVKAEKHDLGIVLMNEIRIGNIYGFDGGNYAGNVYDKDSCSPTIRTYQGGNQQPCVVAMCGRNPDNPSDRTVGSPTEQRLEVNIQGTSNCLTSVQKDNLLLEKPQYRIRKLTPRECGRLMGVSDEDIDKMAAVNSNTQLYKQFGNSIVVDIMCAMFENLNINQGGTV